MEQFRIIKYRNDEKEIDIYLQNEDKSICLSQKGIATLPYILALIWALD